MKLLAPLSPLVVALTAGPLHAQTWLLDLDLGDTPGQITEVHPLEDGATITAGRAGDLLVVQRRASDGTLEWETQLDPGSPIPQGLLELPDGALGIASDDEFIVLEPDGRLRQSGRYRAFGGKWYVGPSTLALSDDGTRLLVGGFNRGCVASCIQGPFTDAMWFGIEVDGQPNNEGSFLRHSGAGDTVFHESIVSIDFAADGTAYMAAMHETSFPGHWDGSVLSVAPDGKANWINTTFDVPEGWIFESVAADPLGGCYLVGTRPGTKGSPGSRAILMSFDETGGVNWAGAHGSDGTPSVGTQALASPFGVVLTGADSGGAFLTFVDPGGSVVWSRRLLGDSVIEDIDRAPDGSIVIGGTRGGQPFVARLDADGRIPGCDQIVDAQMPMAPSTPIEVPFDETPAYGSAVANPEPPTVQDVPGRTTSESGACSSPLPRTTALGGQIGGTLSFLHEMPAVPGGIALSGVSFSGPGSLPLPGGLTFPLSADLFTAAILQTPAGAALLDATGTGQTGTVAIPLVPLLIGLEFDVAGLGFDVSLGAVVVVTQPAAFVIS